MNYIIEEVKRNKHITHTSHPNCRIFNSILILVKSCRNDTLRITDFHSTWTQEHVELDESVDSMYYIKHGRTYLYSDAVIRTIADTRRVLYQHRISNRCTCHNSVFR